MGKKYHIGNGKSKEESEIKQKLKDAVGKVADFAIDGVGQYTILIEEAKGTRIKGIELSFNSAYSSAAIPESTIPLIKQTTHDLDDSDTMDITIRDATYDETHYKDIALRKQQDFLTTMVNVKQPHTYQSMQFDIIDVTTGNELESPGVYCEMHIQNIIGLDANSDIKNPYVVENSAYANTYPQMSDLYDHYSSWEGVVTPETNITYKFTRETEDRVINLGSVSVPYEIVREKGLDILPIELTDKMKQHVNHSFRFMHEHEYQEPVFQKETEVVLDESLIKETSDDKSIGYSK